MYDREKDVIKVRLIKNLLSTKETLVEILKETCQNGLKSDIAVLERSIAICNIRIQILRSERRALFDKCHSCSVTDCSNKCVFD